MLSLFHNIQYFRTTHDVEGFFCQAFSQRTSSHTWSLRYWPSCSENRGLINILIEADEFAKFTPIGTISTEDDYGIELHEMVQTYGVASAGNSDFHLNSDNADEGRALLGSNSSRTIFKKKDGHATLVSSISNLLNTIIGSGMSPFAWNDI